MNSLHTFIRSQKFLQCLDLKYVGSKYTNTKHLLVFLAPNIIFIGQLINKYDIRCEEDQ